MQKNLEEKDNIIKNLIERVNSLEAQDKIFSEYLTKINKPDFLEEGDYILFSALEGKYCLEYINDGHKLRLARYKNNQNNQKITVKKYNNTQYCITNNLWEILITPSANIGSEIYFSPYKDFNVKQLWIIVKFGNYYYIISCDPEAVFRCLDVSDNWGKIGDKIILYNKHLGRNQLFSFKKIKNC